MTQSSSNNSSISVKRARKGASNTHLDELSNTHNDIMNTSPPSAMDHTNSTEVVHKNERPPHIRLENKDIGAKNLIRMLEESCKNPFKITERGNNSFIYLKDRPDHELVFKLFEDTGYSFHSFGYKADRLRKFVLHGLPVSFTPDDISAELGRHLEGIKPVHQFSKTDKTTNRKRSLPVFSLVAEANQHQSDS